MPKRLAKRGSFSIDLYKVDVEMYIMFTDTDIAFQAKSLQRRHGFDTSDVRDEACGYALTFTNNPGVFYLVLSMESLDVNTITHETDHIKNYIISHVGINEDPDGVNETSATLNGLINERVFRFLYSNSLPIKLD